MIFDWIVLSIAAVIVFSIGFIIGVCKEKYNWWKIFNCVEPEDFFIRRNPWHNKMNEAEYEQYRKERLKELRFKAKVNLVVVIALLIAVGMLVYLSLGGGM